MSVLRGMRLVLSHFNNAIKSHFVRYKLILSRMEEETQKWDSVKQSIWKRIRRKKIITIKKSLFDVAGVKREKDEIKLNSLYCCCLLYWIWFSLIEYLFCKERFCRGFFFLWAGMYAWMCTFLFINEKEKEKNFQSFHTAVVAASKKSCWSVKKIIIFWIP